MRHLLFVAVLAGCGERVLEVGAQRQAVFDLSVPSHLGGVGDQLGVSLSACPAGGVLAGAPGGKYGKLLPSGLRSPVTSFQVGEAVACASDLAVVGGQVLLRLDGQPYPATTVRALAAHPFERFPVLAAAAQTVLLSPDGGVTGLGVQGDAVAWSAGRTFAVGESTGQRAHHFQYLRDGGVAAGVTVTPDRATMRFGMAVALGDLHPSRGEELAVADPATDRVFIFSTVDGGLLMTLSAPTTMTSQSGSFGASLLVEPGDAGGGLSALWVGNPNADTITRFVGDAGLAYDAAPLIGGTKFGAALAFEPPDVLSVGAPEFGLLLGEGAVYREPISTFVTRPNINGVARECQVGMSCPLDACTFGVCRGGVLCAAPYSSTNGCSIDAGELDGGEADGGVGDAGAPDGGEADAGGFDAGEADAGGFDAGEADAGGFDAGEADAGQIDAGQIDAGGADAGVTGGEADAGPGPSRADFTTHGCSTGWPSPTFLLLLVVLRRRAT